MKLSRFQLLERIRSFEWSDLEVKAAQREVPRDAYETVSAFANTAGGYLVFGVRQNGQEFEIVGVIDFDKVQNEFLSALRSLEKISYQLDTKEEAIDTDQGRILVFYVPEAPSRHKPIYLNGSIRRSFIRRGGCDQKCNDDDIRRFLRLSASQPYESEPVDLDIRTAIDQSALLRYRSRYQAREPGAECHAFDTLHFLEHWALAVTRDGGLRPTKAAILLFGTGAALRTIMPRPLVDCRWATYLWDEPAPDQRWSDRLVCEENLWTCWERLLERYVQNATKPFSIDIGTMERRERPENYISFREAAINLIIHQDFEELTRPATISFHPDRVVFENPGTSRVAKAALLEPGAKDVRNPAIVAMFRRVGLSEQAGTGISAIFRDWRRRGRIPPEIVNDVPGYSFRLSLVSKELMSEQQLLFQAKLGVRLSDPEANALAILCGQTEVTLTEFRASLGLGSTEVIKILDRLQSQVLAAKITLPGGDCYELAPHLRERWPLAIETRSSGLNLVRDQPGVRSGDLVPDQARPALDRSVTDQAQSGPASRSLTALTDPQRRLIAACDTPRSLSELMALLGDSHRSRFRQHYLQPLLDGGLLQFQFPDVPHHPRQRYVLTAVGVKVVARTLDDSTGAPPSSQLDNP